MSQLYDVIKIKEGTQPFTITGRGLVVSVDLVENNMTNKRKELRNLLNHVVEIEGELFKITGFQAFGLWDDEVKSPIGLLIKPYKINNNER